MDVTTTSARVGKFDARFFHSIFEEEIGRVKGHFGPINSVIFHPDGNRYVFINVSFVLSNFVIIIFTLALYPMESFVEVYHESTFV